MTKKIIKTQNAPAPPPSYSQGVVAAGLVFVSGQGPFDPGSGEVIGKTIQEQTPQCIRNVAAILEAAGSSLAKVGPLGEYCGSCGTSSSDRTAECCRRFDHLA